MRQIWQGRALAALSLSLILAGPVQAAGPVDPDWPCIQRRQPALSVAQVWAGEMPGEAAIAEAEDPAIRALGQRLSLRRLSLEDAGKVIDDFAKTAAPERLTALFLATFERIQTQRDRVMSGITRYARKQEKLDREIEALRHAFAAASAAEAPDYDALDRMEADLDWMTRIFLDRQQSLTSVCESPVILEQRAFAIARMIAARL